MAFRGIRGWKNQKLRELRGKSPRKSHWYACDKNRRFGGRRCGKTRIAMRDPAGSLAAGTTSVPKSVCSYSSTSESQPGSGTSGSSYLRSWRFARHLRIELETQVSHQKHLHPVRFKAISVAVGCIVEKSIDEINEHPTIKLYARRNLAQKIRLRKSQFIYPASCVNRQSSAIVIQPSPGPCQSSSKSPGFPVLDTRTHFVRNHLWQSHIPRIMSSKAIIQVACKPLSKNILDTSF